MGMLNFGLGIMDRKRHVLSVRGPISPDLKKRISELQARAILERLSRNIGRSSDSNSAPLSANHPGQSAAEIKNATKISAS